VIKSSNKDREVAALRFEQRSHDCVLAVRLTITQLEPRRRQTIDCNFNQDQATSVQPMGTHTTSCRFHDKTTDTRQPQRRQKQSKRATLKRCNGFRPIWRFSEEVTRFPHQFGAHEWSFCSVWTGFALPPETRERMDWLWAAAAQGDSVCSSTPPMEREFFPRTAKGPSNVVGTRSLKSIRIVV